VINKEPGTKIWELVSEIQKRRTNIFFIQMNVSNCGKKTIKKRLPMQSLSIHARIYMEIVGN
jgi:hypothetical protein